MELRGGQRLRVLREALGYTMRDVETGSLQVARRLANDEYAVPPGRLSDIETKGVVPSIFRLYSLAVIYRCDYRELLSWYGVDLNNIHADLLSARPTQYKRAALSRYAGCVFAKNQPLRGKETP